MSLKVTIFEEPRVFAVSVGANYIGKVTSYFEKGDDSSEAYYAERATNRTEKEFEDIGYYSSLKEAGEAIVSYSHGDSKIDKVTERLV